MSQHTAWLIFIYACKPVPDNHSWNEGGKWHPQRSSKHTNCFGQTHCCLNAGQRSLPVYMLLVCVFLHWYLLIVSTYIKSLTGLLSFGVCVGGVFWGGAGFETSLLVYVLTRLRHKNVLLSLKGQLLEPQYLWDWTELKLNPCMHTADVSIRQRWPQCPELCL